VTEVRVAGGDVTSYKLEGLEKYTWYEVSVQPYYQSVVGLESTAQVRTLDDGRPIALSYFLIISLDFTINPSFLGETIQIKSR